jgi:APA family basic amino acid/polyamine antiporter
MGLQLLQRKNKAQALGLDASGKSLSGVTLEKTLTLKDIIGLGVALIVGAGIFSKVGTASFFGGPAVILLFLMTAIVCAFAGLSYAQFASMVPAAGSSYTYAYISLGELVAWLVGWALVAEYGLASMAVAISWSDYFTRFISGTFLYDIPLWLSTSYGMMNEEVAKITTLLSEGKVLTTAQQHILQQWNEAPYLSDSVRFVIDLPAIAIVALMTFFVYLGIEESKKVGLIMVIIKLSVIALVVGVGIFHIDFANYTPFMPNGYSGLSQSIATVFFAYLGFDMISSTAEECKNPEKDLPRGILYVIAICTLLYISVALVLTGMVSYKELNVGDALAFIFAKLNMSGLSTIISGLVMIAMSAGILVLQLGHPRIWMSMSRDGLLPKSLSYIHPKRKVPSNAIITVGLLTIIPMLFFDMNVVADICSMGTLMALAAVCLGLIALEIHPHHDFQPRFKIPFIPSFGLLPLLFALITYLFLEYMGFEALNANPVKYVLITWWGSFLILTVLSFKYRFSLIPAIGFVSCFFMATQQSISNWTNFLLWMSLGVIIYCVYGRFNSTLRHNNLRPEFQN